MSVTVLLSALEEYLSTKRDEANGCQEEAVLLLAKKKFAYALNQYVDWRMHGVLEERAKQPIIYDKHGRSVEMEELLKLSPLSVSAIKALEEVPAPPESPDAWVVWMEAFKLWYETTRKKGLRSP